MGSRGAELGGSFSHGGPPGVLSRREPLSSPQLREWFARHTRLWSGAAGAGGSAAGGTVATGVGGAPGVGVGGTGAGAAGVTGAAGPGGARTGGTGAAGPVGARTGGTGAAGAGGAAGARAGGTGARAVGVPRAAGPRGACTGVTRAAGAGGAAGVGAGDTRAGGASSGGAGALGAGSGDIGQPRPYFIPLLQQRFPLPPPPASSLADVPDPESDLVRAASPTVPRLLATGVTDPSFESAAAFALVGELVDFAAACRLDYAASLVAESESDCPPCVGVACARGTDVLEERPGCTRHPDPALLRRGDYGPYSSQWQTSMASSKSTGTYVNIVPPPGANIVDGMWIFRVKRPPGSPPAFKARYVARGFSHRQGVDFFQTFSPTPKMTTLWVLLHIAAQRDYKLHSLDFSTAFLQGSLHEEIWLC
ncbi:unnamed protein product [Closterium sp. NIES-54]